MTSGPLGLPASDGRLPQVGELVRVVPNHTCVVPNLFARMVFRRGGWRVEELATRGTVW